MKNKIAMVEKSRENQGPLRKKIDIAVITKVTRVSTTIEIDSKYKWVIGNADIDIARVLRLTSVEKY